MQKYFPFYEIEKHVIQASNDPGLHHLDVRVAFDDGYTQEVLKFCSEDARRRFTQEPVKAVLRDLKNDAQGRERFVVGYFVQYKSADDVVHTHHEVNDGVEIDLSDLEEEDSHSKKKGKKGAKNASVPE